MQGSFWKTVAVVGVIGIGSMAILEVQNQLARKDVADEGSQESLETLVSAGDQTVDATLSDSEFERLLKGESTGTSASVESPATTAAQPGQQVAALAPTPNTVQDSVPAENMVEAELVESESALAAVGAFANESGFNSEPVAAQNAMPPINTSVHADQLVDGGNPFAHDASVAANYQADDASAAEAIQPVGFLQLKSTPTPHPDPAASTAAATPEPAADQSAATPAFDNAFGQETFAADSADAAVPTSDPKPVQMAQLNATPNAKAADAPAKFAFFTGSTSPETSKDSQSAASPNAAASRQPLPDQPLPQQTTQFYSDSPSDAPGSNASGNDAVGFDNGSPMFGDAPAFDNAQPQPNTRPATQPAPQPNNDFPAFGDMLPERSQADDSLLNTPAPGPQPDHGLSREFGSNTFSDDNNGAAPFDEDSVPLPRPEPGGADFGADPPPAKFPTGRPPVTAPVLGEPNPGNNALPFVEDEPSTGRQVPQLELPGSLSIPGMGNEPFDSPRPDAGFDNGQSRNFEAQPEPQPRNQRTAPARRGTGSFSEDNPANGGVREFGAGGFSRDSNPPPASNGTREFGVGDRTFDPRDQGPSSQPDDNRRLEPVQDFEPRPLDQRLDDRSQEPLYNSNDRTDYRRNQGFDDRDRSPIRDRGTIRDDALRPVAGSMHPNLVLEKTAPENATVGTPLDYRIIVQNDGDATAYDVVVEDDVTAAAEVNKAYPQSEFDTINKKLVWKFDEIAPGQRQEITVRVTPTGEGVMDGVAAVKFKSRVKATTVVTAPKLRLQMEGPREVRLGEEVAYRYIITNEGSGEARSVFVRTVLPPSGGLTHPQGSDLEYEIQAMRPGDQREITLVVIASEPGDHQTKAEITVSGTPADQASWRTDVVGAQLQIVRRGPKRRYVGRSATYENIVSNETNVEALDAKVVETVPEGMRFMGATKGGDYNETTRTVTWRINRLGPGRQEQLQLELMPTEAGSKESVVTVMESVGIQSEDYVSTTVVEDLHNVSATISQLAGPVAVGEAFGFTINIDNRGTADATDVELSVEVPEEIQVIGAGSREVAASLMAGNVVKYNLIVRIEPNRKQSFELKLRGKQPVQNGVVKARLQYKQMNEPMYMSESVTIYQENL